MPQATSEEVTKFRVFEDIYTRCLQNGLIPYLSSSCCSQETSNKMMKTMSK